MASHMPKVTLVFHLFTPYSTFHRRLMIEGVAEAGEDVTVLCLEPPSTSLVRSRVTIGKAKPNLFVLTPMTSRWRQLLLRNRGMVKNGELERVIQRIAPQGVRVNWVFNPWQRGVIERNPSNCTVYECYDYYSRDAESGAANPAQEQLEDELLGKVQCVVTTSRPLFHLFKGRHPHVHWTPNGTSARIWRQAPPNDIVQGLRKPICGYVGALTPIIDMRIMRRLVESEAIGSLLQIGLAQPACLEEMRRHDRRGAFVHVDNQLPWQVPGFVAGFDAAIIPYAHNAYAECREPLKLWDYLAAGCPVVSTGLAAVKPYAGLIRLADDPVEFAQAVERAMRENGAGKDARVAAGESRDWKRLGERVLRIARRYAADYVA
jgi:UDP-galactopyranose mutase